MENDTRRARSRFWYAVPILLGILGGIVAYFALRHDNPGMARTCLILGAILTVVPIALGYLFGIPAEY